ncbi:MAG TPA: ABC transporter ATP-binding protein [Gemmataceae bacterium]|nr:ABC transporter ATP-binding protein [Gemmataceae bacterium]
MAPDNHFSVMGLWSELVTSVGRVRRVMPIIARRHKVMLLLATGIMLLNGLLNTAMPVLFGVLVTRVAAVWNDSAGRGSIFAVAVPFFALAAAGYLIRELLQIGQRYLVQSACTSIERDMTVVATSHLFTADLAVLAGERVGALQGRISRSVDGLVGFIGITFNEMVSGLIAIACALTYMFAVEYRVGLLMLAAMPLAAFLALRQTGSQLNTRRQIMRTRENLDGTIIERLGGIEYIRAADTANQEVNRVERVAGEQQQRKMHYQLSMARYESLKALNEGFFHLLVLGLAIYLVSQHAREPGDIITFSLLFYRVVTPLKTMWLLLDNIQEYNLRVDDLLQMLAQPTDDSFILELERELSMMWRVAALYGRKRLALPVPSREPRLEKGAPLIVISNLVVDYATPGGRPQRALRGVSLTVPHGRTVGVAGPTGSGKSTWVKVLLRLVPPAAGFVALGGVPLENIDRRTIGRLFGYVSQTPFLFAGTIEENIAYGSEGATPENVRRAAELARIHEEIVALPRGYQSPVAERGQNLSGGQRQRIALARVFLKDPPILILDEATSALDNLNERAIQEALAATRADRTTILVAHRLTTLRDADEILVFDQGRIVESGDFEKLERGPGLFAQLVRSTTEGHPAAP